MAILTGSSLTFYVDGDSGDGDAVPKIISVNVPESRSMIDVTSAGDGTTVSIPGLGAGSFTVEAHLDLSVSSLETAITNGSALEARAYLNGTEVAGFASAYITRSIQSGGPNASAKATYTVYAAA